MDIHETLEGDCEEAASEQVHRRHGIGRAHQRRLGDDTTQQVTIDDVNAAANSKHAFGGAMNTDGERDDVCRRL